MKSICDHPGIGSSNFDLRNQAVSFKEIAAELPGCFLTRLYAKSFAPAGTTSLQPEATLMSDNKSEPLGVELGSVNKLHIPYRL
jgi:hypothetical protein